MRKISSPPHNTSKARQKTASPGHLPMIEIAFEEWEKKLPWVRRYQALLAKPALCVEDCDVLPQLRKDALVTHMEWSNDQPAPFTSHQIEEKYQTAVNNIVSKFCEPLETKYTAIVENLRKQAPKRNDHEAFTDELKEQYVQAATVRQKATGLLYNPKSFARNFSKTALFDPAATFEIEKEAFKQRYLEILKKHKSLLQTKFSELESVETQLQASYDTTATVINALTKEVADLTAQARKKLVELAPPSVDEAAPSSASTQLMPPPPPPPLPPPFMMGAASSRAKPIASSEKFEEGAASSQPKTLAITPQSLKVPLKRVEAKPTSHDKQPSMLPDIAVPVAPKPPVPPKTAPISIEDHEKLLDKQAMKVHAKEQLLIVMKARNALQTRALTELNNKKRSLLSLGEQIKLRESEIEASKRLLQASRTAMTPPPPPPMMGMAPPPPPPPPIMGGTGGSKAPKTMLANPESPEKEEKIKAEPKSPASDTALKPSADFMKSIADRLANRRKAFESEEDEWEDDSSAKENAKKLEAEKQRQKQEEQDTITAYMARVKDTHVRDRKASKITAQTQNLQAEIQRLQDSPELKELSRHVAELAEHKPSRNVDIPSVFSRTQTEVCPAAPQEPIVPSIVEVPSEEIVTRPGQPRTYSDIVLELLREDTNAQDFYIQRHEDTILHDALHNADPDRLTKAAIIDALIICDYVVTKQQQIATKNFSTEVAEQYNASLNGFYTAALAIRFSDSEPKQQLRLLKDAASEHFKPRGTSMRIFADVLIMLTVLSLAAAAATAAVPFLGVSLLLSSASAAGVVGLGTSLALVTSSFFSQKPSDRKRDLEKRLNDKPSDNAGSDDENRVLKGTPGAPNRG